MLSFSNYPNLTAEQIAVLQAIGPLPEFVYRGCPDISVFPMNTRSGGSNGSIRSSPDFHLVPPEEMKNPRAMYFGTADIASSYTAIARVTVPGDEAGGAHVPVDSLSIQEYYRRSGDDRSLEDFASGQSGISPVSRIYRIALGDILSRMGPETVIIRDGMPKAWIVVGALTGDVPATHIQIIGHGEAGTQFRDNLTGHTEWLRKFEDIAVFEAAARGLTSEPVPRLDLYTRREAEFRALRGYFEAHGLSGDPDALYREIHDHSGVEANYRIADFIQYPFESVRISAIGSEAGPGALEDYIQRKYGLDIENDRTDPLKNLQLHVILIDENRAYFEMLQARAAGSPDEVRATLRDYFSDNSVPADHPVLRVTGKAAVNAVADNSLQPERPPKGTLVAVGAGCTS